MAEFNNAKMFGGIGAILLLIGVFIPYAGPILHILGLILVFIAVRTISQLANDDKIFNNYLYYFILNIVAFIAVIVIMIIGFGMAGGFSWITGLQSANITNFNDFLDYFGSIIGACVAAIIIGWILLIIAALYLRKSYNAIAEYTNVKLFSTTGLIYFIGAITLIVFIGVFILFIGRILEIIAYFSLPDSLPSKDKIKESERRCPNCGRVIPEDARICPYCAKNFDDQTKQ